MTRQWLINWQREGSQADWLTERRKSGRSHRQTDRHWTSKFVLEWIICWTIISYIPPLKFLLCFLCPAGCWQRLFSNEQQRHQDSQWLRLSDLHRFLCCWRSQSIEQKKTFYKQPNFWHFKECLLVPTCTCI